MAIQELPPKPVTTAIEICLKTTVERLCPECGGVISLEKGTMDGDIFNCGDCSFELETVFFDPIDSVAKKNIEDIAQKRGPKKGESYDVSHLDLTASPALIPSPREDEDWGE